MAVVGNVGTYAQVQPVQGPDFGRMVKTEFDKIDAEKKARAKREDEAKAKKQKELDEMSLGSKKVSNITEFETQTNTALNDLKAEYVDAYNRSDIQGMKRAKDQLGTLNYAIDFTNKKAEQIEKNRDNLNQSYYNQFWAITNSINELKIDRKYDRENKEHRISIYEDEEKTKPIVVDKTVPEILKAYEIPPKYNFDMLTKTVENFTKTYKPDFLETMINSGDFYGTKGVETILNDERIESEIRSKAKQMASDVGAKAFYASEKGISLFNFYKMDEKQNKDAEDYFYNELKRGYRDEINLSISQKSQGRGGKDGFNIVQSTLEIPKTYTLDNASVAYGGKNADGSNQTSVNMPTGSISFNVAKEGGVSVIVGDRRLNDIVYDPNSKKMIFALSTSASSRQGAGSGGATVGEGESNKESSWFTERDLSFEQLKNSLNTIPSLRGRIKTKDDIVKYVLGIEEKKVDENL